VCVFGGPTELVRLVGVSISLEKNFYRLPFTPPSLVASSVLQSPPPRRSRPGLGRGRAAAASSTPTRHLVRDSHAKGPPQAFISRPPPLEPPTRAQTPGPRAAANPSRRRFRFPSRRRLLVAVSHPGAAQEGREPSCAVFSIPCTPVALSDLSRVRDPRRRVVPPLHRFSAATVVPIGFAALCAAHRCLQRFKPCPGAQV
jgi:hypothetical protein